MGRLFASSCKWLGPADQSLVGWLGRKQSTPQRFINQTAAKGKVFKWRIVFVSAPVDTERVSEPTSRRCFRARTILARTVHFSACPYLENGPKWTADAVLSAELKLACAACWKAGGQKGEFPCQLRS
jgi:hypothetical protein